MSDFRVFLNENLENDPEFKAIWEENREKRELVKQIIALRIKENLVASGFYPLLTPWAEKV